MIGSVYICNFYSIFKTTDVGTSWHKVYKTTNEYIRFEDVKFTSKDKGWIVGSHRTILYTSDRGQTWINQSPEWDGDSFRNIDALDSLTAIAVTGEGAIIRTDDGGQRWIEQVPIHRCFQSFIYGADDRS